MTHASLAKSINRTRVVAKETTDSKISTGALATFGTISTLMGPWAVACFIGALLSTGGPIALARTWISAVTGG